MAAAPMAARRSSTGRCACSLAYLARKARPMNRMPTPALTMVLPPNSQRLQRLERARDAVDGQRRRRRSGRSGRWVRRRRPTVASKRLQNARLSARRRLPSNGISVFGHAIDRRRIDRRYRTNSDRPRPPLRLRGRAGTAAAARRLDERFFRATICALLAASTAPPASRARAPATRTAFAARSRGTDEQTAIDDREEAQHGKRNALLKVRATLAADRVAAHEPENGGCAAGRSTRSRTVTLRRGSEQRHRCALHVTRRCVERGQLRCEPKRCARRSRSAKTAPSPSSLFMATISPHGSTTRLCPNVRRPLSCSAALRRGDARSTGSRSRAPAAAPANALRPSGG